MQMPEQIITVIRPELTAEERAKREEEVKLCLRNFCVAIERQEQERRNAQSNTV